MLDPESQLIAAALLEAGAIRFGGFRLKLHDTNPNAPLSPIYVDLRVTRSHARAFHLAVDAYVRIVQKLTWDYIADIPTAATAFVGAVGYNTGARILSPRPLVKSHGVANPVEGIFDVGRKVVLIDDLITKADSKFESIAILETAGLCVTDVVVLVDRQQGGAEQLRLRGYQCHSVLLLTEMLDYYYSAGLISSHEHERTRDYLKNA
jgi:uridine monophosphate synthetase